VIVDTLEDGRSTPRRPFAEKATELHGLLTRRLPPQHPLAKFEWQYYRRAPDYWILGTGPGSADLAAQLGACFYFSEHHNLLRKLDMAALIQKYRDAFVPSAELSAPRVAVMVSGFCADTEAEARQLADVAQASSNFLGDAAQCAEYLHELHRRCGGAEIGVLLGLGSSFVDREHMMTLLAEAVGLAPFGEKH
jgi:alkanesulfonate monooxygenase SsuD/methylene tetrahydromethanopterin reductase-like flavin-dependent oxidoreductase (luciferase family)